MSSTALELKTLMMIATMMATIVNDAPFPLEGDGEYFPYLGDCRLKILPQ